MSIIEQQLENLAIGWFRELGWGYVNGPEIAPDSGSPARVDFREVVLRERLLGADRFDDILWMARCVAIHRIENNIVNGF